MTSAHDDLTVQLEPPPGWVQVPPAPQTPGDVLLALAPNDWRPDWGVRPSIVVRLGAPVAGSIRAAATRMAGDFLNLRAGYRVVSWDLWEDGGGRRLLVTYPAGDALLAAMTWVRLEGGRPLSVTATVDVDRYGRVMPLMMQAVPSLRIEGTVPAGAAPVEAVAEPRIDSYWLPHGETLEDLGRWEHEQRWAPEGQQLSRAAFDALTGAGRSLLGGLRVKDRSAADELRRIGLVDGSGRLTEDGQDCYAALAGADRSVRVTSALTGAPGTFEAAVLGETAVVWATHPLSQWIGGPARGRDVSDQATGTLQRIPLMHLPENLAAWLQVGPAWPLATSPRRLPRELVTARAAGDRVPPPPDADAHLRSVWEEPWSTWVLRTDAGHAVTGLRAGRHGHFYLAQPEDEDGVVDLQAFPSEPLFAALVAASLG